MSDVLLYSLGVFLLVYSISYLVWARVRVRILRQDLFVIRDELWDRAKELDAFNDAAYMQCREHLNACIQLAHLFSWRTVKYIAGLDIPITNRPRASSGEVQRSINDAYAAAVGRISEYVLMDCASGRIAMLAGNIKRAFRRNHKRRQSPFSKELARWIKSPSPVSMAAADSRLRPHVAA